VSSQCEAHISKTPSNGRQGPRVIRKAAASKKECAENHPPSGSALKLVKPSNTIQLTLLREAHIVGFNSKQRTAVLKYRHKQEESAPSSFHASRKRQDRNPLWFLFVSMERRTTCATRALHPLIRSHHGSRLERKCTSSRLPRWVQASSRPSGAAGSDPRGCSRSVTRRRSSCHPPWRCKCLPR